VIYVNAGVVAPPKQWLIALRPGGRLIFPWRPTEQIALAAVVTRVESGFEFRPLMPSWFIPSVGASTARLDDVAPDQAGAWRTRSVWFKDVRAPDRSATAIYHDLWFSDQPPSRPD